MGRNPTTCMSMLMGNYQGGSTIVPQPNKYYVFVYKAKTPNIQYDEHPFILCGDVFSWGFTGYNIHWQAVRRYTWLECISNLFEINQSEVDIVTQMPLAKFVG